MKIIYKDGLVAECPKEEELEVIRHTASHIMAQAIKRLFPEADFGYGPATEKGFYYDVDLGDIKLTDEDLQKIENEMKKIVKENLPIKPFILGREEAIALMTERSAKYKVEHIGDLPEDAEISFYQQGEYIDMCTGPHLCYTKALKAFKITQQSGAYWKNDKDNAEKFFEKDGTRYYRTGDLCYFAEDGNLMYVSRKDFQVKINGFRVELGEIENRYAAISGGKYSVVIPYLNEQGNTELAIVIEDKEYDVKEHRTALANVLPAYEVPSLWLFLRNIPLNQNGKIDRKAIKEKFNLK